MGGAPCEEAVAEGWGQIDLWSSIWHYHCKGSSSFLVYVGHFLGHFNAHVAAIRGYVQVLWGWLPECRDVVDCVHVCM